MNTGADSRATAALLCRQIVDKGRSLDTMIAEHYAQEEAVDDRPFVQELIYGVCRWYGELNYYAEQLLQKPIRNKDRVLHFLLLVGLYQLRYLSTAPYAAVSETVAATRILKKQWASKMLNSCLRRWQRESKSMKLLPSDAIIHSHPEWFVSALRAQWSEYWPDLLRACNDRPTMCLRVNSRETTRANYLSLLADKDIAANADAYTSHGIRLLKPVPVSVLPKFTQGAVSVQDTAAQLAAQILQPKPGMTVLDACAAPGGKTAHLLETANNQLDLQALDISSRRVQSLQETLARLKLTADVFTADATELGSWPAPTGGYDQILIDAPCSGTGVIHRHPDIKYHRDPASLKKLQVTQAKLLRQLWALLKQDGRLLYMTCSVLNTENEAQVQTFLANTPNAEVAAFKHPNALRLEHGFQTLPGVHDMDGFYFCLIHKRT